MTDDELLAIANRVIDVEGECNVCDSLPIYRAIYAAGREELAREIKPVIHDWFWRDCAAFEAKHGIRWTSQLTDVLDVWLKQKGVM